MARIFTTPEAEKRAKTWLHDLTLAGGLRTQDQRGRSDAFPTPVISEAQTVCDELINREFANIDDSIRKISWYRYFTSLDKYDSTLKKYKPEFFAKCIVYMAELVQLYWDDTIRTPYEIEEFKKTYLGAAVFKYGRYISAIKNKKTRTASSKTPGQPPKNNYKQSGPQSANVRDLKGEPNEKVMADTNLIYKIIGENPQSKNIPNVFIKPLSASGAEGTTNRIFVSSGNGYTDCTCYFDDPNDAQDFLTKVVASNRVPANITNLHVVKNKADANGYFLVGTEFGDCAISAKTLNEALNDSIKESTDNGWIKATENYTKTEKDELHTWMRRG